MHLREPELYKGRYSSRLVPLLCVPSIRAAQQHGTQQPAFSFLIAPGVCWAELCAQRAAGLLQEEVAASCIETGPRGCLEHPRSSFSFLLFNACHSL